MAEELRDVRAKLSSQAHEDLSALAQAKGRDMGDLLREAVELYLADETRKAHEYKVFLRMKSVQGADGAEQGTASR
jgi:hypothetical protein